MADFATYAERHDVFGMLEEVMRQLVIEQPRDPLSFIKEVLVQPKRPRIIVHGPPAAGCTTLAQQLASRLGLVLVHAQTAVQQAAAEGTKVGLKIKGHLQAGTPVPSSQITKCIIDRLQQPDCRRRGWVLFGFPTTRAEAAALQMEGVLCTHFLLLNAPDAVLMERYPGKRVDPATGEVYHQIYRPPPAELVVRKVEDDNDDTMSQRLETYRREVSGIASAHKASLHQINADQPQNQVLEEALLHLSKQKKSLAPVIPRVCIVGPPGAGKTTVSRFLSQSYGCVHVQPLELMRKEVAKNTKLGNTIKPYLERDMPVPDKFAAQIIVERLWQQDCVTHGWVLDGFPENRTQATLLRKEGFHPSRIIVLEVASSVSMERLCQRRIDPQTGQWYHLKTAPAPTVPIMNRLVQLPRDGETEVQKRIMHFTSVLPELKAVFPEACTITTERDVEDVCNMAEAHLVMPRQPVTA